MSRVELWARRVVLYGAVAGAWAVIGFGLTLVVRSS